MENFGNSVDWWMSTKSPRAIFRAPHEADDLLRDAVGVDPTILAVDTGLSPMHVEALQRQLGLRKFKSAAAGGTHRPGHRIRAAQRAEPKIGEIIEALVAGNIGTAVAAFDDFHRIRSV